MKREYATGQADNVSFFCGVEIEKTPAYGKMTLFVTGMQEIETVQQFLDKQPDVQHIFFGANHSFCYRVFINDWVDTIAHFLDRGYLCSLDIPYDLAHYVKNSKLNKYENFIPQIRVVLPEVESWNKNATIKIDDEGFNASNPGVWVHPLISLINKDSNGFTDWSKYKDDQPLT